MELPVASFLMMMFSGKAPSIVWVASTEMISLLPFASLSAEMCSLICPDWLPSRMYDASLQAPVSACTSTFRKVTGKRMRNLGMYLVLYVSSEENSMRSAPTVKDFQLIKTSTMKWKLYAIQDYISRCRKLNRLFLKDIHSNSYLPYWGWSIQPEHFWSCKSHPH